MSFRCKLCIRKTPQKYYANESAAPYLSKNVVIFFNLLKVTVCRANMVYRLRPLSQRRTGRFSQKYIFSYAAFWVWR